MTDPTASAPAVSVTPSPSGVPMVSAAPAPPHPGEPGGVPLPDPKGLRWIAAGAVLGLVGALTGIVAPVALLLLGTYSPAGLLTFGPTLVRATSILALTGLVLFAISLLLFRTGFAAFRHFDRWFWSASLLCIIGTLGYVILAFPTGVALLSSDSIFQCVQEAPSSALSCLRAVAPMGGYVAVLAFWLIWIGQLGIVVGLVFTGRRFREPSLYAGTICYGLLLLVFIAPFLGLLFSSSALIYGVLAATGLGLVAPGLVVRGAIRAPTLN